MTALAGIGGWTALDEIDRRAVERLIEVNAAGEPAPALPPRPRQPGPERLDALVI